MTVAGCPPILTETDAAMAGGLASGVTLPSPWTGLITPAPDASLTGQLINQSGRVVSVAHVLGTFYNKSGQVVWVADQYVPTALLPGIAAPFNIHIPEDLAKNISTQRTVVASYTYGGAI